MTTPSDWLALNLANWNERVPIHLNAPPLHYRLDPLKKGTGQLDPIAANILGRVDGLRVLHLQCHFGQDSLAIAQQGAAVTGLDFSPPAIAAAKSLAAELGLSDRARFVEANVYDAAAAINEPESFDRVFVSWGALVWLPDIPAWARIVSSFLKPNGFLALAEAHPAALVFDDRTATPDGRPGWYMPYLGRQPMIEDRPEDYADPTARLNNCRTVEFLHPLSDVIMSLVNAGLRIDRFHEHHSIVWQLFAHLAKRAPHEHVWPGKPWLPLSYSLRATKSSSTGN
jgi:SAM-dependent methyltransferase